MNSGEVKFNSVYQWQAPSRRNRFGISAIVHVVAILLLIKFGALTSIEVTQTQRSHETLTWIAPQPAPLPQPNIAPPPPKILAELRKPQVLPPPVETPPPPKIEAPKVEAKIEPPKVEVAPPKPKVAEPVFESRTVEVAKAQPPKKEIERTDFDSAPAVETRAPRREVADAGFGGSSAPATVKAPPSKVQTGGFGDPNGVPAQNSPNREGVKIAALGSFDLPNGSGYGNGTGGSRGIRGTVADSGFGNGAAMGGSGSGTVAPRKSVASAGFSNAADPVAAAPRTVAMPEKPQLTPVEITFKPKPAYTNEARELHIEGDVLLEVNFGADGQLRVLRVVRGLGHGLDESAQKAAQLIKFKPAARNGQPTDSTAMVHIVFELAE
jgi:TonB family protein